MFTNIIEFENHISSKVVLVLNMNKPVIMMSGIFILYSFFSFSIAPDTEIIAQGGNQNALKTIP